MLLHLLAATVSQKYCPCHSGAEQTCAPGGWGGWMGPEGWVGVASAPNNGSIGKLLAMP